MITPRTYTVLSVLNDLKDAFITLLEKPNKHPALLMMYAFIDICAALANDDQRKNNQAIFVAYLERFMTPGSQRAITPLQLWAARSALLHTFSPLGRQTRSGKVRATFYYSWNENKKDVRASLERRGYTDFALLSINDVKSIAIWTFNDMFRLTEQDEAFRSTVLKNAEHLLLTQNALAIENFLQTVEAALPDDPEQEDV